MGCGPSFTIGCTTQYKSCNLCKLQCPYLLDIKIKSQTLEPNSVCLNNWPLAQPMTPWKSHSVICKMEIILYGNQYLPSKVVTKIKQEDTYSEYNIILYGSGTQ